MIAASVQSWERALVMLAEEARQSGVRDTTVVNDRALLKEAYARCEAVIAEHGKTFNMAITLLPPPKRRAIRALYAFCRVTDDIVDASDEAQGAKVARLAAWRRRYRPPLGTRPESESAWPRTKRSITASRSHDIVALAWTDTRLRYKVPYGYCEQLIDGVARDLHQQRYDSFEELAAYAYGVASTVGLMMLRIIGTAPSCTEEEALPYVIKMGLALQITNILRDVGEDRRAGRVYLPADELRAWGIADEDLAEGGSCAEDAKERWRGFMRFQIERNRALYREAWPCIRMFNQDGRFCVAAMCSLYRAILNDIEKHDYDVINRRAHVSSWGKLRMLPGIWWQSHVTLERSAGQGSRSGAAGR